jgi:vacuolar-type H+-ATPase subunit D/Vma8
MNKQESNLILELVTGIQRIDFKTVMKYLYTDGGMDTVVIGEFTPREMTQLLTRAIYQLRKAIIDDDWRFLPFKPSSQSEDLSSVLRRITSQLNSGNPFEQWVDQLIWLVQYERQNGLWQSAEAADSSEFDFLKNEIRRLTLELQGKLDEVAALSEFVSGHRGDVEMIHNQYQSERQNLGRLKADADIIMHELRQAELDSASSNGKAAALLEQLAISTETAQRTVEQERVRFTQMGQDMADIQQSSVAAVQNLAQFDKDFSETLQGAKDKEKHILDQKDEIAKLRGFAADIALGSVFGERQRDLQETVKLWRTVSFTAIGVAIVWIVFIFWDYRSQTASGVNWLILLANVVRTSPAFLLVYFCLDRYTKERNIQEEYAFKAAVSMTITAYAEMIKDEPERVKMLVSTVQGVYTPPILGKPFKPVSLNSKHLADSGKSVAEAVKNVKEMIGDVTKAAKSSDK